MNGHQGLKPTDVVGPPHSPRVKMAFSLEEAPCFSTGFFTLKAFPIMLSNQIPEYLAL